MYVVCLSTLVLIVYKLIIKSQAGRRPPMHCVKIKLIRLSIVFSVLTFDLVINSLHDSCWLKIIITVHENGARTWIPLIISLWPVTIVYATYVHHTPFLPTSDKKGSKRVWLARQGRGGGWGCP